MYRRVWNVEYPRFALNAPPALRQKLQGDAVLSGQNPSRRFTSRVAGPPDLWVFWNCKKHDGLSRVLDLSVGGLCLSIERSERMAVGEKVHLNFLTPQGQIRTDAIVYDPNAWAEPQLGFDIDALHSALTTGRA